MINNNTKVAIIEVSFDLPGVANWDQLHQFFSTGISQVTLPSSDRLKLWGLTASHEGLILLHSVCAFEHAEYSIPSLKELNVSVYSMYPWNGYSFYGYDKEGLALYPENCSWNFANRTPYAVPSRHVMVDLLQRNIKKVLNDGGKVSYIEAHGTGTRVGDRVEVSAFKLVLSDYSETVYFNLDPTFPFFEYKSIKGLANHIKEKSINAN